MEERIVDSRQAFPHTSQSLSTRVENEMAEGTWMAKQQLMKPIQLGQFVWSTSSARDQVVCQFRFPGVMQNLESIVTRTLRMYAFYKLSPTFRIQINSTQFHQGQLICAFDPFSINSIPTNSGLYLGKDYSSIFSATGLPHVKIMASESDAVELKIPYIHPRSFLTTNALSANNDMGTFFIRVMNPLVAAEGASPSLTVTVWMYANQAEVHVPIQDHEPILEATSKIIHDTQSKQISNLQQHKPSFTESLSTGVGQISNIIGNVATGNFGQALRKGQGLIDTVGNIFGFDYPSESISPPKTISPVENLAVCIGKSRSQRLAVDPMSLHILQDDIASESLASMDLLKIAQIPMLISQYVFSNSNAAQSTIFTLPCHPNMSPIVNTAVQKTYLSFLSEAFVYWSGGLTFDIEIVATRFHSGKLLLAYVPNTQEIPTYDQASDCLPNVIIDIQQTSSFSFNIPFTSSTPLKLTNLSQSPSQMQFVDASIGTLVCYVQNTLAYASNVSPSVEINVYLRASPDFSFYIPRKPIFPPFVPPDPPSTQSVPLEATSGTSLLTNNRDPTTVSLTKDQASSNLRPLFGEDYSLKDIIKRFSYSFSSSISPISQTDPSEITLEQINVNPYPLSTRYSTTSTSLTFLQFFSLIYSAWSGSIRYKIMTYENRSSKIILSVYHVPTNEPQNASGTLTNLNSQGYAHHRTNVSQDNALEIEVPFYSKYNLLLTRSPFASFSTFTRNGYMYLYCDDYFEPEESLLSYDIYEAAGEDFRFIYLRPPPLTAVVPSLFTIAQTL